MRVHQVIGAICGCLVGVSAFGQATLPAFYSGPWVGAGVTLPTGWTSYKLGPDYSTNYDGEGGPAAKFDTTGDWLKINFNGTPSTISYWVRGNSLSGAYIFKVRESANGSTWSDVVVYNTANPIPNNAPAQYTNSLLANSRYVQFIYTTKATGNVGLDGVHVKGPDVPSITFNPPGTTNAPVSNEFTMAVTITPSGSGLKSWSMTPTYSGAASLSAGTFRFTPAAADQNKTFTLSVVASNAIGSVTNTAQIKVTPYTPPVPVITFSPPPPYEIMATTTQKIGIGVTPAGSGIQSWSLQPAYTGSATLTSTNFTFIPAEADGPSNYTFKVVATNIYGATTAETSIAVTAYVPAPPPSAYVCSFEDGTKTGYASGDVTLSNKTWNLTGILIGTSGDDLKIGSRSARLKYVEGEVQSMTIQTPVMANGIGAISLWYGPYGTHGSTAPTLAIEIAESPDSNWISVGEVNAGAVETLTYFSADVYVSSPIYVRIRAVGGTQDRSANFDNIAITPYTPPAKTDYEVFLLKYNVTPGDPGTEPGDDYDGDGFTNQQEFEADTNPYDPAIHP